ncbi:MULTISPECIES: Cys-Gln thioester bond-forming surface protein [unclassified Streptomyces]|uniref:Cys-Gln thioester bond-forming surface protein n=1 Tax=unclassified Streptomyces TaxID=2593676 RepID=UPI00081E9D30|nr:LPXTG-motif cell wall anchor domain-containing protein/TQXA domain-containing protein [Streptomyces sp. ScaeMP-e83]
MFSASSVSASPSDAKAVHAVRGGAARTGGTGRAARVGETGRRGRGRAFLRPVTALLLSGLVAAATLAGTGTAAADDPGRHQGGAAAVLDGLKTFDSAVLRLPGENGAPDRTQELPAGLFEMTVDGGGKLKTYCIDLHNPTQDQAKYLETPWAETSLGANRNAGKIRWILQHSYPQVDDLAALAEAAGTGPLTERTAAAGTQVAIWRYSDGADVTASDKQAEKLADWLHKSARNVAEPRASLTLEPAAVSGRAGDRLGPVTVRTDADQVSVSPPVDAAASGITVTDEKGAPVTSATDGARLYFDVPRGSTDGSASLTVQTTTSVPVGRAFAGTTRTQTQILAGSSESTVSARATATWAETGAAPALTARKNCAAGGVDITAANQGDEPFTFELGGYEHTVAAGATETVTIPVAEDQPYDFTITGPGGLRKNFTGVLDCATSGSVIAAEQDQQDQQGDEDTGVGPQSARQSVPASTGTTTSGLEGDLAETGGSSTTPMIAALAVGFLVIGGGALLVMRRKEAQQHAE